MRMSIFVWWLVVSDSGGMSHTVLTEVLVQVAARGYKQKAGRKPRSRERYTWYSRGINTALHGNAALIDDEVEAKIASK